MLNRPFKVNADNKSDLFLDYTSERSAFSLDSDDGDENEIEPRGNRDKTQRYSKYIVRGFDVTSFARGNTESRDDEHARGERRPASELEGELDDESSMKPRSDGEATESRGTTNRSASRRDTRATKTSRYDAREKLTTPCDA
ncbi:uncharacterized protein LOC143152088 isoform X2 [Ptiloglossa arizonensis]|uniref:uncharacterized protein LOC143152088 isoform X2 n=1 Tax=Ptiloglossa arizonensis TaxID=3350558 RepID=UPI003FA01B2F